MKTSIKLQGMSARSLEEYAEIGGAALARAHARTEDAAMISVNLRSSDTFDQSVTDFAANYAHLAEQDHQALKEAVQ